MAPRPILVLAWGNRSRGDDALGPLFADALRDSLDEAQALRVDIIEAHLLQPELALDLMGRQQVLLVDADPAAPAPFALHRVQARRDATLASHALSPAALLAVCEQLHGAPAPPATLLALHAQGFGLGAPISPAAEAALPAALAWARRWIDAAGRLSA